MHLRPEKNLLTPLPARNEIDPSSFKRLANLFKREQPVASLNKRAKLRHNHIMLAILRAKMLDAIVRIAFEEMAGKRVRGVNSVHPVLFEREEYQLLLTVIGDRNLSQQQHPLR
jgi:hypothetical protein